MRTAKPRPGSRFRGRGAAAEGKRACLGPYPGPWEKIPRTVTRVERYPEVPGLRLGASGFAVGRVLRTRGFVLRGRGNVCPQIKSGGNFL